MLKVAPGWARQLVATRGGLSARLEIRRVGPKVCVLHESVRRKCMFMPYPIPWTFNYAASYATDLQYLCIFMPYPMPWTFNIYAFVQGIFYYMDFLIYGVFLYMALLGSGPRAFGAQDVCIFTRDPEPSGLRIYAFLHGTLSLEGSGCTHFCTGP